MNINWIMADSAQFDPTINLSKLKDKGSFWGSWQTYRSCSTDNAICYDNDKAKELITKGFNKMCNFYVSNTAYPEGAPQQVNVFGGAFEHEVGPKEEIIAMHFCNSNSDIVLLYGFDWSKENLDNLGLHYRGLITAILSDSDAQWVLVDHSKSIDPTLLELDNLTSDTLSNVLTLL